MKKRDDGRYRASLYLGMVDNLDKEGKPILGEDGRPLQKKSFVYVYGRTQEEVKSKMSELRAKRGKGIKLAADNKEFGTWADMLIADKKASGVSYKQIENLESYKNHLDEFKDTPLDKINPADIQRIINYLSDYHAGKKGLSKETLRKINRFAKQVFEKAIGSRIIDYNPAKYVVIAAGQPSRKREAISETQRKWIEDTPHKAQTAAMLMLYAGLRRGEMLALTWADIDLKAENPTIRVSKAVEFEGHAPKITTPKTEAGNRIIPIPQRLAEHLREVKSGHLYVVNDGGALFTESKWRYIWKSYMIDLDIKYGYEGKVSRYDPKKKGYRIKTFTPHQLRHAYATMLYYAGVDVLRAKYLLGHTDIKVTLGIYTHLEDEQKTEGASELDAYLEGHRKVNEDKKASTE